VWELSESLPLSLFDSLKSLSNGISEERDFVPFELMVWLSFPALLGAGVSLLDIEVCFDASLSLVSLEGLLDGVDVTGP